MNIIAPITAAIEAVGRWAGRREERKAKQHEGNIRKLEAEAARDVARIEADAELAKANAQAAMTAAQNEHAWDMVQAQNQARSWKDEVGFVVVVVMLLAIIGLGMVEGGAERLEAGFAALEKAPAWVIAIISGGFAMAFGIKGLSTLKGRAPKGGTTNERP